LFSRFEDLGPDLQALGMAGVTLAQAALAVSVLSLIVVGLLGLSQRRISNRLAAIEEARRAEEVDTGLRAAIVANIEHETSAKGTQSTRLVLVNYGAAPAWNVTLDAPSAEDLGIRLIGEMPISVLASRQDFRMTLITSHGSERTLPLTVTWEDGLGQTSADFTLSVF
jgi:hypothetical protein